MGEIAEMMLEGILDEQTGEYLGEAVGYPRTKQRSKNPVYGVRNFLYNKGYKKREHYEICKDYLERETEVKNHESFYNLCCLIQMDFRKFASYIHNLKTK